MAIADSTRCIFDANKLQILDESSQRSSLKVYRYKKGITYASHLGLIGLQQSDILRPIE